ncbi:Peroxidase [Musa troglodytarum]|uniref:Peroxidase n=1 Tax=Musa troglodytarum TaxID=320322 RepID=A0A9E7KL99_9LILI|nr:Peroxidase [Musa troglodytarum]
MIAALTVSFVILLREVSVQAQGGLQRGFYSSTCPRAEAIVRSTVEKYFNSDSTMAAGLLRLHFHDCFVQRLTCSQAIWHGTAAFVAVHLLIRGILFALKGCDGSVLISGASAERSAVQNLGLRGFEVVDDAKSQLEATCPGVVSCADVLALAARDAVDLSDGPSWSVPLGRRDGLVSSASDATSLPSPTDSVAVQRQKFADKGLTDHDLVTLVGAHTIGQTACVFVRYRLYNFTATGNADPTINQAFLGQLQAICPHDDGDFSSRVALDKGSMTKFDASYFKNVRDGNGVLESDQRLWEDDATQDIVGNYAGNIRGLLGLRFAYEFSKAMIKLSSVGVTTGTEGQIRTTCSKFN